MMQMYNYNYSYATNRIYLIILLTLFRITMIIQRTMVCIFAETLKRFLMNRIKEILKEKKLTQQELADMLGVTRISIVKTLAGNPSQETFERIATALNVPMWQLFASPEEVRPKSDALTLTCPHCGKDINLKID